MLQVQIQLVSSDQDKSRSNVLVDSEPSKVEISHKMILYLVITSLVILLSTNNHKVPYP